MLTKDVQFEILTFTVLKEVLRMDKTKLMEAQVICHFLKLVQNHELRLIDVNGDAANMSFDVNLPLEVVDLDSISCSKDSKDCITLVIGEKEVHVNSFILTNNSPVFKAMLSSTDFKEGQNKKIEFPGKKFNEVVYFLHFLRSFRQIQDSTDVLVLAPLCQEYQVDWISNKIKSFLLQDATKDTETILRHLVVTEKIDFGSKVEKKLKSVQI
uniref:BTB domain-containing protein n=1 Tax=Clytia hemisphaerica TaxID=252671 RepID=A0A7M5UTA3_9CNID